jgi:hypothetical protein
MDKKKPVISDTGMDEEEFIINDTGRVSHRSTDEGKMAYVWKRPAGARPLRGRPPKLDWPAAMRWLVVKVSRDGLPEGYGAQAEVESWVSQWFINQGNDDVSETMVREHVHKLFDDVKTFTDI